VPRRGYALSQKKHPDNACKQAAYRERQKAKLDTALLDRGDLARAAIREGVEPWRAFCAAHIAKTAAEARAFLGLPS
jgi:hypothetical protein